MPYALPTDSTDLVIVGPPITVDDPASQPLSDFAHQLDELEAAIARDTDAIKADAQNALATNLELGELRGMGEAMRQAYLKYNAERRTLANRDDLSAIGKEDGLRLAEDVLGKRLQNLAKSVASSKGDTLVQRFPMRGVPPLNADVSGQAQMIHTSFHSLLPDQFVKDAAQTLDLAVTTRDSTQKTRAVQLLKHAYLPLVTRRAHHPEPHAKESQGVAVRLEAMITAYLDNYQLTYPHRLASIAVERLRGDFDHLVKRTRTQGWDDVYAMTAAPSFHWPQRNG